MNAKHLSLPSDESEFKQFLERAFPGLKSYEVQESTNYQAIRFVSGNNDENEVLIEIAFLTETEEVRISPKRLSSLVKELIRKQVIIDKSIF